MPSKKQRSKKKNKVHKSRLVPIIHNAVEPSYSPIPSLFDELTIDGCPNSPFETTIHIRKRRDQLQFSKCSIEMLKTIMTDFQEELFDKRTLVSSERYRVGMENVMQISEMLNQGGILNDDTLDFCLILCDRYIDWDIGVLNFVFKFDDGKSIIRCTFGYKTRCGKTYPN